MRNRHDRNAYGVCLGILSIILMCALGISQGVQGVFLKKDCLGYLKRAADANTVEVAHREITVAIDYIEKNHLTSGYTSVVYNTPDEDIGFWHENLKAAQAELAAVMNNPASTSLERSNVLMKLRETLLDKGESGDHLTYPSGLAWYPHNATYALAYTMLIIVCGASFLLAEVHKS